MNAHLTQQALRPIRGRARSAVATLVLAGAAWATQAVWHVRLAAAGLPPSGLPNQGDGRHRPLTGLENAYHVVSALADAATLLCAVAFLLWLSRVRDNAHVLSGRPPRHAWPWVLLGWIVPVAQLWVPRGIVVDAHQRSAPKERVPRAVNWWWGLWLAGIPSGILKFSVSTDDVIARAYRDVRLLLAADVAVVAAAVAAVFVVRELTAVQQKHLGGAGRPKGSAADLR
ncbi:MULTISPECIES: DUF4328 domain-containing protein [Streptomyces]|uniref:DUF4328 domain-containing protein n=1 Tax=Streptomyces TaxID=1883 RepID=UPI001F2DD234|nr:DUF4328 domain-containing protein [Streptomyces noursei]MCE4941851.1 DUF4328 domain-containing protein [Streptomyces noursei]